MSQRTKEILCIAFVTGLFLLASNMDYHDQLESERIAQGK